jgi:quercetin dioxygenase-like cupin family protein
MSLIGRNEMRVQLRIICVLAAISIGSFGCANHSPNRSNIIASTPTTQSDPPSKKITVLMTQPLSEPAGKEVRVMTVEYPPGARSAPHRHPGAIFAYVLDGEVLCQVEGQPLKTYRAGEVWYEYPQQLHQVSGNASATVPAKLLVFFLTEAGKPVVLPEK